MLIGVVSDTHGLFDPLLEKLFARAELIVHAGDICGEHVVDRLRRIAPVVAIRGNCDEGLETELYPDWVLRTLNGWRVLVVHDLGKIEKPRFPVKKLIDEKRPDLVISGHSHFGRLDRHDRRLYLNPGSAGKKRFRLERSAALLSLRSDLIQIELHSLEGAHLREIAKLSSPGLVAGSASLVT